MQHAGKYRRDCPGTAFPGPLQLVFRFRCIYYDTLTPVMQYHFLPWLNQSRRHPSILRHFSLTFMHFSLFRDTLLSQVAFSPCRDKLQTVYDKHLSFLYGFIVK